MAITQQEQRRERIRTECRKLADQEADRIIKTLEKKDEEQSDDHIQKMIKELADKLMAKN